MLANMVVLLLHYDLDLDSVCSSCIQYTHTSIPKVLVLVWFPLWFSYKPEPGGKNTHWAKWWQWSDFHLRQCCAKTKQHGYWVFFSPRDHPSMWSTIMYSIDGLYLILVLTQSIPMDQNAMWVQLLQSGRIGSAAWGVAQTDTGLPLSLQPVSSQTICFYQELSPRECSDLARSPWLYVLYLWWSRCPWYLFIVLFCMVLHYLWLLL